MSKTIGMKDGSFFVRPNGQLLLISETDKGEQDLVEAFTTPYIDEENYGNELYLLVGNAMPYTIMEAQVGTYVKQCFDRFYTLQLQDEYLSENEEISEIVDMQVQALGQTGNFVYTFVGHTASGRVVGDQTFQFSSRQTEPPTDVMKPVLPNTLTWPWAWTYTK